MTPSPGAAAPQERDGGLLAAARNLLATAVAITHTRLELITTEIEEELYRVASLLVWAFVAIFFGAITVLMAAFLVVILWWEGHRVLAASAMVLLFLGATAGALLVLRHKVHARPKLMHATIEELKRDRDALEGLQ